MKKFLLAFLVFFIMLGFIAYPLCAEYWASKESTKYHYPTCKWAQKIAPKNLIQFSSPEQAIKAGYLPCKLCKPPGS